MNDDAKIILYNINDPFQWVDITDLLLNTIINEACSTISDNLEEVYLVNA